MGKRVLDHTFNRHSSVTGQFVIDNNHLVERVSSERYLFIRLRTIYLLINEVSDGVLVISAPTGTGVCRTIRVRLDQGLVRMVHTRRGTGREVPLRVGCGEGLQDPSLLPGR